MTWIKNFLLILACVFHWLLAAVTWSMRPYIRPDDFEGLGKLCYMSEIFLLMALLYTGLTAFVIWANSTPDS